MVKKEPKKAKKEPTTWTAGGCIIDPGFGARNRIIDANAKRWEEIEAPLDGN